MLVTYTCREPYTSPVPGHKRSLWKTLSMVAFIVTKLPSLYSVRPTVTEKRIVDVSMAPCCTKRSLDAMFSLSS